MSRRIVTIGDITVGLKRSHRAEMTQEMINRYAELTGDFNPVHVSPEYAQTTRFGRCIAHGMLTASLVQVPLTAMTTPGGVSTVYHIELLGPVHAGDKLEVVAECIEVNDELRRAKFRLEVVAGGSAKVLSGEAEIAFPRVHW